MSAVRRPFGVILSAAFLFIGATLGFACCIALSAAARFASQSLSVSAKLGAASLAAVPLGAAAWAIISGVGILRLREWARLSTLILEALVAYVSLYLLIFAFVNPLSRDLHQVSAAAQPVIVAVSAVSVAFGVWFLVYLTREKTAIEFRIEGESDSAAHATPLSILIIGWYSIISGVFLLFSVLLTGRSARLVFISYGISRVVLGVGLLKLYNWARIGTICYFVFLGISSPLFLGINSLLSMTRLENATHLMIAMGAFQRAFVSPPGPAHPPMWFGVLVTIPLALFVSWVLVARKSAFLEPAVQPSASTTLHGNT
ncbi:MAG TPA: hypothetical protein VMF66_05265 [Candidatus Acidoferrum sp.]|nr:hypothetical protein [Candidatus Acidoferrum sp.]